MKEKQKAKSSWMKLSAKVKDAGLVCYLCGISRPAEYGIYHS